MFNYLQPDPGIPRPSLCAAALEQYELRAERDPVRPPYFHSDLILEITTYRRADGLLHLPRAILTGAYLMV